MIRIRFVTGSDFLSTAIRIGERDGWCTHTEAIMPDGTMLGAHLDGGVQARPAGYDVASTTRELVVTLDASPREDAFHAFLRSQLGKPYDFTAIAGYALNRDWREPDSWFCSELMAAALVECGYLPRLAAINNHVSPRDLLLVLSGRILINNAL